MKFDSDFAKFTPQKYMFIIMRIATPTKVAQYLTAVTCYPIVIELAGDEVTYHYYIIITTVFLCKGTGV